MYNILSIIYYMSYSIIAPQALVGIPLPTSDEISDPMEFMKYVVKRHNIMEGIKRTNFFLNTQEPGLIFQTPDGSRFVGAAKLNGKHVHMSARRVPSYVNSFNHPYIRSLPPPYGTILMGVNDGTFGPTAVIGPGGAIGKIRPIETDGRMPIAAISSFGVRNYVPINIGTPVAGSIAAIAPFAGGLPVPISPLMPGLIGININRKDDIERLSKLLKTRMEELEGALKGSDADRINRLREEITKLVERLEAATAKLAEAKAKAGKVIPPKPTTISVSTSTTPSSPSPPAPTPSPPASPPAPPAPPVPTPAPALSILERANEALLIATKVLFPDD
jgi:hypothetical protein